MPKKTSLVSNKAFVKIFSPMEVACVLVLGLSINEATLYFWMMTLDIEGYPSHWPFPGDYGSCTVNLQEFAKFLEHHGKSLSDAQIRKALSGLQKKEFISPVSKNRHNQCYNVNLKRLIRGSNLASE